MTFHIIEVHPRFSTEHQGQKCSRKKPSNSLAVNSKRVTSNLFRENREYSMIIALIKKLILNIYIHPLLESIHTYLYIQIWLVWVFICLFVCIQFFWGISRDPREGLWMIKFKKICLHQNSIFKNFENPRNFFFCYLLTRRTPAYFISNTIFTNEIKDPKSLERRARSALNF